MIFFNAFITMLIKLLLKIDAVRLSIQIFNNLMFLFFFQVLCELQVALVERGVTPRPDVTRSAMLPEYRAMSSSVTYRNLRDWLIFRDYMNGLEYVVQIFEHLRKRLQS